MKSNSNNIISSITKSRKENGHTLDCTNVKAWLFSFILRTGYNQLCSTLGFQFQPSSIYSYNVIRMFLQNKALVWFFEFLLIVCALFFRISEKKNHSPSFLDERMASPSYFVFRFRLVIISIIIIIIIPFCSIVFNVQAFALIIFISSYSCSVTVVKDVKITSSTFVKILWESEKQ